MVRLRKNTAMFSKGSLFVDAAIALPIFILTLGILLQFVITIGREEKAYYTAETTIQSLGAVECKMKNLGHVVDDPDKGVYIEHVQSFPIIIPNTYLKAFVLSMDMPYKTFIEESPDKYKDSELVWIFPKNEGNEKEGPKYHTVYCRTVKGGQTKGLEMIQVTKSEAESRGYSLCHWCSIKSAE